MGSKLFPDEFDCYAAALPDEPMFVLLARDPDFARLVEEWAEARGRAINCGDRPESDRAMVASAKRCAAAGAAWRVANQGRWQPAGQETEAARLKTSLEEVDRILTEAKVNMPSIKEAADFLGRMKEPEEDLFEPVHCTGCDGTGVIMNGNELDTCGLCGGSGTRFVSYRKAGGRG